MKDLKLQIHLHKAFFSDDRFLDSLHKHFLNQATLDLRKKKWTFLNQEFTVLCKGVLRLFRTTHPLRKDIFWTTHPTLCPYVI